MAEPKPLSSVQKDVDNRVAKSVYNPLESDFTHKFDGEEFTIPAGKRIHVAQNVAVLLAKHLAAVIVRRIAKEDRERILEQITDKEERRSAEAKPYPLYSYRVGDVAKLLVLDPTEEAPKASDILREAQESSAREKEREGKKEVETKKVSDVLIGEEEAKPDYTELKDTTIEEEEVELSDLSDEELRVFAKENGVVLGNTKDREKIIAKIEDKLA